MSLNPQEPKQRNEGAPRNNLVMGAAIGYSYEQIEPFLRSLQNGGYQGDVALIVDPVVAKRHGSALLLSGVKLIPASQWIPYRFGLLKNREFLLRGWHRLQSILWLAMKLLGSCSRAQASKIHLQACLARHIFPPSEARYLHYYLFLRSHPYSRVLITDVRDVLFQRDPFGQLPESGLAVSMEDPQLSIAEEPHNTNWVRLAYGQEMLNKIGRNQISCSGVTYGDGVAMEKYLQLMSQEILRLSRVAVNIGIGGTDQGIHNVLLWTGKLGDCVFLESLESAVATLNGVDSSQLHLNVEGRLLNRDGGIVSVVHQYDRVPKIGDILLQSLV